MMEYTACILNFSRRLLLIVAGSIAVAGPSTVVAQTPAPPKVAAAPAGEVHARGDIGGNWQGTLEADKSLRIVLKIAKADKGWSAKMYSIDQGARPFNALVDDVGWIDV